MKNNEILTLSSNKDYRQEKQIYLLLAVLPPPL